jgi:hypothetical protein
MNSMKALIFLFVLQVAAPVFAMAQDAEFDWVQNAKWGFYGGYEFPGAKGTVTRQNAEDREVVNLFYDFSGGGAYVAAKGTLEIPEGATEFRFAAKADRPHKLVLRLVDATKQTHQWELRYEQAGQWQDFSVDLTKPAKKSFGGASDGVMNYPLREIMLCVAKSDLGSSKNPGEVWFAIPKVQ